MALKGSAPAKPVMINYKRKMLQASGLCRDSARVPQVIALLLIYIAFTVLSFWGFYRQSIKNRQILFGLYQFKKKKKIFTSLSPGHSTLLCFLQLQVTFDKTDLKDKCQGSNREGGGGTNFVIKFNSDIKCPFLVLMTPSVCNCSARCTHVWLVGVSKSPCRYVQTKKDKWIKFWIIFVSKLTSRNS